MRYDSDPQVIQRILTESHALDETLDASQASMEDLDLMLHKSEPLANTLLSTLDHFIKMHFLNPQLSVSRFSASNIEQHLVSLSAKITQLFSQKTFSSVEEQMVWNKERFLSPTHIQDLEALFLNLNQKINQLLDTYYVERIRQKHFAALLNDVVGWTEHIETHGHHDIHAVILFAEKIARDRAVITHRLEVVREICALVRDQAAFHNAGMVNLLQTPQIPLNLSRIYSPYLLALYEALLEDIEIIVISEQDYDAFERYCRDNQIDIYEDYRDIIKDRLKNYVRDIAADIPATFQLIKIANKIARAERLYEQYQDIEAPTEVLGRKFGEDISDLQHVVHQLRHELPKLSQRYFDTLQKIQRLRRQIVRPAIRVYGQYLKDQHEFFSHLAEHQSEWLPIIESALACLEQDDELYLKCFQLKQEIDEFIRQRREDHSLASGTS